MTRKAKEPEAAAPEAADAVEAAGEPGAAIPGVPGVRVRAVANGAWNTNRHSAVSSDANAPETRARRVGFAGMARASTRRGTTLRPARCFVPFSPDCSTRPIYDRQTLRGTGKNSPRPLKFPGRLVEASS